MSQIRTRHLSQGHSFWTPDRRKKRQASPGLKALRRGQKLQKQPGQLRPPQHRTPHPENELGDWCESVPLHTWFPLNPGPGLSLYRSLWGSEGSSESPKNPQASNNSACSQGLESLRLSNELTHYRNNNSNNNNNNNDYLRTETKMALSLFSTASLSMD